MEIKAELILPYTDKQRMDFIVEQNHELGYEIRQVETTYKVEEEVPYTEIETEEIQVPIFDEEGNPVLDKEGNPTFETQIVEKEVTKYRTETVEKTGYNLEAWGYTEEEKQKQKRERIDALTLTPADVERALYAAKGMDFNDLKALIAEKMPQIDMKALAIEFRARDFYRGAMVGDIKLFDAVGALIGYTSEDMDYLFEHKQLPIS